MSNFDLKKVPSDKKRVVLKANPTPYNLEKELENFNRFMVTTIAKRFENQVIKAMNQTTIDKFQDAQIGSYIAIFTKLYNKFLKSINRQFSKKRIERYIKRLYQRTNRMNDRIFYKEVNNKVGVDVKQIIKTDGLNTFVNAKSLETALQIEKMKREMMGQLSQNVIRLMNAGKSLDTLYDEVKNTERKNLNKSELVARNELKVFNSQLSDKRAFNLGIQKATWNTVGDERTRKCHAIRDGKEYDINKGLYSSCDGKTLKTGEEINCRCYATYIVEFE